MAIKKKQAKAKQVKKSKRSDFIANDAAIEEAFMRLFVAKKRKPTWEEVAKDVNVDEKTIRNHFKSTDIADRMEQYRMGTGRVMAKLFIDATTGKDVQSKRLWLETVEGLGSKKEIKITEVTAPKIIIPGDESAGS